MWVLIFVSIFSYNALAQGSASGCLLNDNRVYTSYTSLLGARLYASGPSIALSPNYCSWSGPKIVTCNVCFGAINAVGLLCIGGPVLQGHEGVYTMVECNLDDYSWALGASAAFVGFFVIRKRKII
ncbi:MAG: hypothetical protein EOO90_26660 [Pedobacter sp.]|nr:MAG: hypothetical protein EOO90_26660 [Pedobacter sp.]